MKKFEGIRFLHFAQLSVVFTGSHSEDHHFVVFIDLFQD